MRYYHTGTFIKTDKIVSFDEGLDPYQMTEWVDDLALWPPVEFGSIFISLTEILPKIS